MSATANRFDSLKAALAARLQAEPADPERPVRLLLDTDSEIGRHEGTPEGRVGFTPEQGATLAASCRELGLPFEWAVVAGAGDRAGFTDAQYADAGAAVHTLDAIAFGAFRPDIVHALKEPAPHEARIPGPYTRIGAAHIEVSPPGIVEMIRARNVGVLIGGRTVGGYVHQEMGGDSFPIVNSMSRFAGRVAAERVAELTTVAALEHQTCLIVGAGVAGLAAAGVVFDAQRRCADPLGEVLFIDMSERTLLRARSEIERAYPDGRVRYRVRCVSGDRPLVPADFPSEAPFHSIILAAAGRNRAPRVAYLRDLVDGLVEAGGTVADIGIDQGGCITFYDDSLDSRTKMDVFRKHFEEAGRHYFGEVNMPRAYPHEASMVHGEVIQPYLLALVALHAYVGTVRGAAIRLCCLPDWDEDVERRANLFDRHLYELASGIQLYADPNTGVLTVPEAHRGTWYAPGNGVYDAIEEANAAAAEGSST